MDVAIIIVSIIVRVYGNNVGLMDSVFWEGYMSIN